MPAKKKVSNKSGYQIGLNIAAARIEKGISQKELADELEISKQHLSLIEKGDNSKIKIYYKAADILGIAFEDLAAYHITHKKEED